MVSFYLKPLQVNHEKIYIGEHSTFAVGFSSCSIHLHEFIILCILVVLPFIFSVVFRSLGGKINRM